MYMKKPLHIVIILFCFGLITLFSCKEKEKEEPKSERHGGILNIEASVPISTDRIKLSPSYVGESAYLYFLMNEFESLTKINPGTCKIEPSLAKSWDIKESGKVFIFHLRNDVYFSYGNDNELFTAKDVKKCFDSLCYPDGNVGFAKIHNVIKGVDEFEKSIKNGSPLKEGISGVKIINDSTISFELTKEYVPFPQLLSDPNLSIYRFRENSFYGTGPFIMDTTHNAVLEYTRNPKYWKKDEEGYRLPYLDKIRIVSKIIDNNPNRIVVPLEQRLKRFLTDSLHILRAITADDIGTVMEVLRKENDKDFNYESIDYARLNAIAINNYAKPFNDYRVRKAFELAFDADLFVDSVLNGEGWPANYGFMPPGLIAYTDSVREKKADIVKAKKLLAEAGYSNLSTFPTVVISSVRYKGSDEAATKTFNQAIEMICNRLGLKYEEKVYESYNFLFKANYTGNFVMCPFIFTTKIPSPEGYLNVFALKIDTNVHHIEHDNIMFYRDSVFDDYYFKALKEVNQEVRLNEFLTAERRMFSQSPILPLFYTEINRIVSKDIQGLSEINNLGLEDYTYTYFSKTKK